MTAPTPTTPPQILNPDELAGWLRDRGFPASVAAVREWLRTGALPGYKLGQLWATPLPALENWEAGRLTVWSPALLTILAAVEAGQIQTAVPAGTVPIAFVGRRAA